jgi:hypothetical protein
MHEGIVLAVKFMGATPGWVPMFLKAWCSTNLGQSSVFSEFLSTAPLPGCLEPRLPGGFCQTKKWLAFFVAAHHFGAHEPVLAAPAQPGKLDFLIGEWRSSP